MSNGDTEGKARGAVCVTHTSVKKWPNASMKENRVLRYMLEETTVARLKSHSRSHLMQNY